MGAKPSKSKSQRSTNPVSSRDTKIMTNVQPPKMWIKPSSGTSLQSLRPLFLKVQQTLPCEIVIENMMQIVSHLQVPQLASLSQVCKSFYHFFNHDLIWEPLVMYYPPSMAVDSSKLANKQKVATHFLVRKNGAQRCPVSSSSPRLKVVLLSEGGSAGKTAFVIQWVSKYFVQEYDPTIEDVYSTGAFLPGGDLITLDLLDTAGQEEFAALRDHYMRDLQVPLIFFALDNKKTFDGVSGVIEHLARVKDRDPSELGAIVVGTKRDLITSRQVAQQEALDLCAKYNYPYFEISNKENADVSQVIGAAIRQGASALEEQLRPRIVCK